MKDRLFQAKRKGMLKREVFLRKHKRNYEKINMNFFFKNLRDGMTMSFLPMYSKEFFEDNDKLNKIYHLKRGGEIYIMQVDERKDQKKNMVQNNR
jgi:hypothetical protein